MGRAREKLLATAARRFYADGITATGIDTITAEAGVAKMSLYNNFAGKDDLVVAYLDARHAEWLGLLATRLRGTPPGPGRVLAVFDAYLDHAAFSYERGFRGCGLLNGAAELPVGHPGRDVVRGHKAEVRRIIGDLCAAADLEPAEVLADHLYLLVEGGVVSAGIEGTPARLEQARALAAALVAPPPPPA